MKKSLSLVLAIAMVFSMFSSMAFAGENQSAGDYLKEIGVIKGTLSGDLQENDTWSRQDVTVILSRLMGVEADAEATAKAHTFADVENPFYDGYISWAKAEGLFNGHSDVRFGYGESISNQQFLAVMTRALGYNFDYNNVVEEAIALGLVDAGIDAAAEATRGSYYNVVVQTLHTVTADGQVLGNKLSLDGFAPTVASYEVVDASNLVVTLTDGTEVELELETALKANEATIVTFTHADVEYELEVLWEVSGLLVDQVVANYSLKQVQVVFNQPVDAASVKVTATPADSDTIRLYKGSAKEPITVVWNADKTVATITSGNSYNQEQSLKVVVDGLYAEGAEASKLEDSETTVKLKDIVAPSVTEVSVSSSKTMEITFSEPVNQANNVAKVWDDIMIDDAKAVGTLTVSDSNPNQWTLTLNNRLSVGAHTVSVKAFKDFATFTVADFSGSVTVLEDTTAPTVTGVEVLAKNKIKVTFSEPITTDGYINVKGVQYNITQGVKKDSTNYEFTLTTELDAASTYGETLRYKNITDNEGNKVSDEATFAFNAPVVSTKPVPTFALSSSGNVITVEFDRLVMETGANGVETPANYELLDKDNKAVAGTFTITEKTAGKKYEISHTALATVDPAAYTLKLKNVKDASVIGNTMADAAFTFTANDTNEPTISAGPAIIDTNKVKITFSEAMDPATLSNLSNYIFTDASAATSKYLSDVSGSAASVASDNKSVTLTIKDAVAGDSISLLGIKDANGKQIGTALFNVAKAIVTPDAFDATDIVATATGLRTIELVATGHAFESILNPNHFYVKDNNAPSTSYYVTNVAVNASGSKATLTLNSDMNYDATVTSNTYGLSIYTHTGDATTSNIKDTNNVKLDLSAGAEVVVDGIKPEIKSVSSESAGTLRVTFQEAVNVGSATTLANDIVLKDKDGNYVTVTAPAITFSGTAANSTYFEISGLNSTEDYTITVLARNITDIAGKALVESAAKTVKID